MEYIDIISLLNDFSNKCLSGVTVYGKVTRILDRPSNIQSDVLVLPKTEFVEISVHSVNLSKFESYLRDKGLKTKDSIYMVNGKIVCAMLINDKNNLPTWCQVTGSLRLAEKVAGTRYVGLLNYYKQNNQWFIGACTASSISFDNWDETSEHYKYMKHSLNVHILSQPKEVADLPEMISEVGVLRPLNKPVTSIYYEEPAKTTQFKVFNRECRNKIKDELPIVSTYRSLLSTASVNREVLLDSISSDYESDDSSVNNYIQYMLHGILEYKKKKILPVASTGQALLKSYLSNFKKSKEEYLFGATVEKYLIDIFDEIVRFMIHGTRVNADGVAWEVCAIAFGSAERFYAGILSYIVGVPYDDMISVYLSCENYKISFSRLVNENPYLLQLLSPFKFNVIEKIALYFNKHLDTSLDKYRDIAMLNDYICNSSNGSTIYKKDSLYSENIGLSLTSSQFNKVRMSGSYLTDGAIANIQMFLRAKDKDTNYGYSVQRFKKSGYNYVEVIPVPRINKAIENYVESGLGIVNGDYITSFSLLKKELFVYDSMKSLGLRTYNYDYNEIEKYIAEYEDIVGFRLEERQREAVHLVINAGFIVAGGAGSGKTTVSKCIVYVLSKLEPNLDIQFAAPTGKAAKRMQEVVQMQVKTLHSKFGIGLCTYTEFDSISEDTTDSGTAYFIDEGAMISLDLMYQVLKKVNTETSRFFLFGDFDQLSPIGKGLPFKNLLRFMPCVFLNVSKRAVEGSKITANSNLVNQNSDNDNWVDLQSGDDFYLIPCGDNAIQSITRCICGNYLGYDVSKFKETLLQSCGFELPVLEGITPDDIQVVSPLATESYDWGSRKLNTVLQPLFNTNKLYENTFNFQVTEAVDGTLFMINDRVIHTEKNMYGMQWYSSYKNGNFTKAYGYGICNGEVGKIVGFYNSLDCSFLPETGLPPEDFSYPEYLRDDTTIFDEKLYFVVVEYYDYISDSNFYILYRAELNDKIQCSEGITFKGEDLAKLNLFYAGTTHKLQGSQAKVIICCIGNFNREGFITREMIYTMFTRGEKLVIGVGSVDNSRISMLSRARKDISSRGVLTIGEVFCE